MEPSLAEFPKQSLVQSPHVGREYDHRLYRWSYGLAKALKGIVADESTRQLAQDAIEHRHPELARGEGEWTCGDWPE